MSLRCWDGGQRRHRIFSANEFFQLRKTLIFPGIFPHVSKFSRAKFRDAIARSLTRRNACISLEMGIEKFARVKF